MSDELREKVREHYGKAALRVLQSGASCGCGPSCGEGAGDPVTQDLYDSVTTSSLPETAVLASLGCGNPTALAELKEGEVVLDLGSGGGIDVLLSAKRVGPTGKAYGLDMTDEMLALARRNAAEAGVTNVEFLRGHIEEIPLPTASVDVIISNCVINLSGDKRKVLAEALRVLKPGGRFAVADIVVRGGWDDIPPEIRRSVELWAGCMAGALGDQEFVDLLREVGFESPSIEPTRIYRVEEARAQLEEAGFDLDALAGAVDNRFMAAFVRATQPAGPAEAAEPAPAAVGAAEPSAGACCAPGCCG